MNTPATATLVREAARDYSQSFTGLARLLVAHRPAICPFELIVDHVPENARVFDIGCGSGFLLYCLARVRRIASGFGVEVDALRALESQALLRARLHELGHDGEAFGIGSATSHEQWPGEPCGVVTMVDVLHHVPPPVQDDFLAAALARVDHGGLFLYKDMCVAPLWRAMGNQLHDLVMARQWVNHVPMERVQAVLRRHGFVEVARASRNMLWYGHEFVAARRCAA